MTTTTSTFISVYLFLDAILAVYGLYSWYQQARIELSAVYRTSSIVWSVILIWLGFIWNFIEKGDPGLPIFVAIFLVISILDGFSGLGSKKIVLSGYFRRTLTYQDLEQVTLIAVNNPKQQLILAILHCKNNRAYYLRFKKETAEVIKCFKKNAGDELPISLEIMK